MRKLPPLVLAILGVALLLFPTAQGGAPPLPSVVISEVRLDTSQVELVNTGEHPVDLSGYQWMNKPSGSPQLHAVLAGDINAELSTSADLLMEAKEVLTFDLPSWLIFEFGGEVALLSSLDFTRRSAMVDFLEYGQVCCGLRSVALQAPALWNSGAIDIRDIPEGHSMQLKPGADGNSSEDYLVAPATLGVAQSLVPVSLEMTRLGFVTPTRLFIEFTYSGQREIDVMESQGLDEFEKVEVRTTVSCPEPGRIEFEVTGEFRFFRLQER